MLLGRSLHLPLKQRVSILTRAEARVLPNPSAGSAGQVAVSILTRAEARVLPKTAQDQRQRQKFQSSPAPRRGCCVCYRVKKATAFGFNPHPRRGAGAARVMPGLSSVAPGFNPHPRRGAGAAPTSTGLFWMRLGFNPHPRRGAGAAGWRFGRVNHEHGFNPHPRRGAGAAAEGEHDEGAGAVSILTRAEARVLPGAIGKASISYSVSILTRAEARVLPLR